MSNTKNKGFALMNVDQQKVIARRGGLSVSSNREHMSEIGKKGGEASAAKRRETTQSGVS